MSALGANRTRRDGRNDVNDPNRTSALPAEPIAQIFIELLPDITVGLATPSVVALSVEESSPRPNQKLRQAQLVSFIFGEGRQLIVMAPCLIA
jgi:hypothetical protein